MLESALWKGVFVCGAAVCVFAGCGAGDSVSADEDSPPGSLVSEASWLEATLSADPAEASFGGPSADAAGSSADDPFVDDPSADAPFPDDDERSEASPEVDKAAALDAALPREVINASYDDCPPGNICFFNETRGRGDMCRWTEHDTDWNSGSTTCSWAGSRNVCSVWNRTIWRMEYFKRANYQDRVGSTTADKQGDLACSYKLASHRKQF